MKVLPFLVICICLFHISMRFNVKSVANIKEFYRFSRYSVHWNSSQLTIWSTQRLVKHIRVRADSFKQQLNHTGLNICQIFTTPFHKARSFGNRLFGCVGIRLADAFRMLLFTDGHVEVNPGPAQKKSGIGRKSREGYRQTKIRRIAHDDTQADETNEPAPANIGCLKNVDPCTHCNARTFPGERSGFCCDGGKLCFIPLPPQLPIELQELYSNRHFLDNLRTYNNVFALASIGCSEVRAEGFSPIVKVHGKVHHFIGSLIPSNNSNSKYAQLYFYDPKNELNNRMKLSEVLDRQIVEKIQSCLHKCNPYIQELKAAADQTTPDQDLSIILKSDGTKVTHLPTSDEIAGILRHSDGGHLDVIFQTQSGHIKRINELHRTYDPLHYILLLPHGTSGYHLGIKRPDRPLGSPVSGLSFYKYLLQERELPNPLLHSRRLSQQYAIDQFCKIESSRMNWHRFNQKQLRAEKYQGLMDSVNSGDNITFGKRIILPPTYYGSPRWFIEAFHDAMTIVRKFGKPDLFITFTCNPKWDEILTSLHSGEKPEDRPDLTVRVFHEKLKLLLKLLTKDHILGKVIAYTCVKEDQKRGLPIYIPTYLLYMLILQHCHILLIMHRDYKPRTPEDIDKIISAEIPDKAKFPVLFKIVTDNMIHGPCGQINRGRPCMEGQGEKDTCLKGFPKRFNNDGTSLSEASYPNYSRRDPEHGGHVTEKILRGKAYVIDNRWIVPYSPQLSYLLNAHVNVEIVISVKAVKYLYKYITKGADKILFAINPEGVLDEIANFATARYVSATEAFWRLYSFEIMKRYPGVQKLALHLPNQQSVLFEEGKEEEFLENGPPNTTLTAYFELNKLDTEANNILYPDVCQSYRFQGGKWIRRKLNTSADKSPNRPLADTIGRIPIITLNPKQAELFYLRMLLYHVPGATDYEELRKVNGNTMATFREACLARGLLSDDSEIDQVMNEMSAHMFGMALRDLFCTLLVQFCPKDPTAFWERHKDSLSEDFAHSNGRSNLPAVQDYAAALHDIQTNLQRLEMDLGNHFGIQIPEVQPSVLPETAQIDPNMDIEFLSNYADQNYLMMTNEQKSVFNEVIESVDNQQGICFSLNAAGGTGKTFVLKAILAKLRSKNEVAVATAISGIAATLMPIGRTLHSKMKVPIEINDSSMCDIAYGCKLANELRVCKLMIIDEITMGKKQIFEAVDRSLRDIRKTNRPFGGITTVLSGDWRQILPVIKHGSKAEIIDSCLKQSSIWEHIAERSLTKNMRLSMNGSEEEREFAEYLLRVGEGRVKPACSDYPEYISVPEDMLLNENKLENLCDFVYADIAQNQSSTEWLSDRSLLTVTNESSETANREILVRNPCPDNIRLSADTIVDEELSRVYPTEFLNSVTPNGMPPHYLNLKTSSPIMLIRNLDAVKGHCNGTRYIVTQCHQHVIEATVTSGLNIGAKKLIPRIPITCSDSSIPFSFKRVQFPVKTCYSMTINKSQGQSFKKVGIYLDRDIFAHEQLYVALSRVRDRGNLRIVYPKENDKTMKNVVYKEVL